MVRSESATALLAPGFRFHPTDEELVSYYLKRKVAGKPLRFDAISLIDIYRSEPWDLPFLSRLKTRDLEWYFFSALDKKHGNGSRTNRATEKGYWKTTGKDRPIRRNLRMVGMKKTLVFHLGRAPRGERTNWVMHEYRLEDLELDQTRISKDMLVLCRVFQKSGPGPKNGEQYGAPLVDEEWDDDDEEVLSPKKESIGEENADAFSEAAEWGYPEMNNSGQVLDIGIQNDILSPGVGYYGHDGLKESARYLEGFDEQKSFNNSYEDDANFREPCDREFVYGLDSNSNLRVNHVDQYLCSMSESTNLTEPDRMCNFTGPTEDKHQVDVGNGVNPVGSDYLAGEAVDNDLVYLDALDHTKLPTEDDSFLEINDLFSFDEADASGFEMLDEYLMYFDATNDNLHDAPSVSSEQAVKAEPITHTVTCAPEVTTGTVEASVECPQTLKAPMVDDSSLQKPESSGASGDKSTEDSVFKDGWDKSLAKHFSNMLGSITAPPAFAVEYSKASGKSVGYNPSPSTPVRVNAGLILISELRFVDEGKQWLMQKGAEDLTLTKYLNGFERTQGAPLKMVSVQWQAMLYLGLLWFLILAVSFKISICVCTE